MSVAKILRQIRALPQQEQWQILEQTRGLLEPEIPESFKEGIVAIARGDVIDLDEAMPELRTE